MCSTVVSTCRLHYEATWSEKVIFHPILIILNQGMLWSHWWCWWYHIMSIPAPVVSHDQKSYIASHFNCLVLRNPMVPLTTLLGSCDINANSVNGKKSHVAPHFSFPDPRNAMVPFTTLFASHDTNTSANGQNVMLHLISIVLKKGMQ